MAASLTRKSNVLISNFNLIRFNRTCKVKLCNEINTLVKKADINPTVDEDITNEKFRLRNHPGSRHIGMIILPKNIVKHSVNILKEYDTSQLKKNSEEFCHFLRHRVPAWTEDQIKNKSKEVEAEITRRLGPLDLKALNSEEQRKALQSRNDKIRIKLKQCVYHWKPLEYSAYKGYLYLYGRACANYAVTFKVFDEIMRNDPSFKPKTVFDFGSGVGTTIWAAKEMWGNNIKEMVCVDISDDMNSLATLILKGKEENDNALKGIFFRQFLPATNVLKYDLVVCSYALLEMATIEERIKVIDTLWSKTQDMLVIIDKGTQAGFQVVLEARDYILQNTMLNIEEKVHVVAPCPHEQMCPKFIKKSKYPCGFRVKYKPFTLEEKERNPETEIYSYVVLRREKRSNKNSWPRLIAEVLPRTKHVICRMCCNDGQLHEIILSKAKAKKNLYQVARISKWGDLLPLDINLVEESQETEETQNENEVLKIEANEEAIDNKVNLK